MDPEYQPSYFEDSLTPTKTSATGHLVSSSRSAETPRADMGKSTRVLDNMDRELTS